MPLLIISGWLILWYLVWGIAALYAIMTISIWTATLRTLGVSSLRHCPRIFCLSLQASPIRELIVAMLVPFALVLLESIHEPTARYLEVFPLNGFLLMAFLCFTLFLVPPTMLVFSTSTDERLRWALTLKRFTGGRRVISLLDTGYMTLKPSVSDAWAIMSRRALTLTDVLRTSDTNNWQAGVRELIELAPIVVVDTRVSTRALDFEAFTMLTPKYAHKAIFVSNDDGSCPVLEGLVVEGRIPPDLRVSIVKEDELGQVLRRLVISGHALPRPGTLPTTPYTLRTRAERRSKESGVPETVAAVPREPDTGTKRLSIALTPVVRFVANAQIWHIVLSLVLGSLVMLQNSQFEFLGISRTAWLGLLVIGWASSAITVLAGSFFKGSVSRWRPPAGFRVFEGEQNTLVASQPLDWSRLDNFAAHHATPSPSVYLW